MRVWDSISANLEAYSNGYFQSFCSKLFSEVRLINTKRTSRPSKSEIIHFSRDRLSGGLYAPDTLRVLVGPLSVE